MAQTTDSEDRLDRIERKLDQLSSDFGKLSNEVKTFDTRFGNYQQATQWVVQLAFTLITSATVTVIITSVLRRWLALRNIIENQQARTSESSHAARTGTAVFSWADHAARSRFVRSLPVHSLQNQWSRHLKHGGRFQLIGSCAIAPGHQKSQH